MGEDPLYSDREAIRSALLKTGFLLEYQISRKLECEGWEVAPNYHVEDMEQGVSREIDVFAARALSSAGLCLRLGLAVECKNTITPIVLLTRPFPELQGFPAIIEIRNGPLRWSAETNAHDALGRLYRNLDIGAQRIRTGHTTYASQFCQLRRNGKELEAIRPGDLFLALGKKTRAAALHHLDRFSPTGTEIHVLLFFPVLITAGSILTCQNGDLDKLKPASFGLVYQDYASRTYTGGSWINVVHEASLLPFLHSWVLTPAQSLFERMCELGDNL